MVQTDGQDAEAPSTTLTSRVGDDGILTGTGSQDPFIYLDLPNLVLTVTRKLEGHTNSTDSGIDRVVSMIEKLLSISIKGALENVENPSDVEAALMLSFRRVVLQRQDESDEGSGIHRRMNERVDADSRQKLSLRCAAELHGELIAHSSISINSLKGGLLEYLHAVTEPTQFSSLLSSLLEEDDAKGILSAADIDVSIADSNTNASMEPHGEERSSIPAIQEANEEGRVNEDDTKFWDIFDNSAVRGVAIGTIALVGVGCVIGAYFLIRTPRSRSTRWTYSTPSARAVDGAPRTDLNPDWFEAPPVDTECEEGMPPHLPPPSQQMNPPSGGGDANEVVSGAYPKTKSNQQSIARARKVYRPPPANEIFTSSFTSAEDSPDEFLSRDDLSDVTWQTPTNLHIFNKNGDATNVLASVPNTNDELDRMVYASMNGLPTIAEERSSQAGSQPPDPPADGALGGIKQVLSDLLFMEV
mmetsp:Transcript_10641/g.21519  ORF Transcript_10641/g.21519 Transcript_10641/m.21519 type:complete len:472 (-) Transcript_10641:125-1540(-)